MNAPMQDHVDAALNPAPNRAWHFFGLGCIILLALTINDMHGLSLTVAPKLRVFGAYWASGAAANSGANPFVAYPLTPSAAYPGLQDVNLNPPCLLPIFSALAQLDPVEAARGWILAQALAFMAGAALLVATTARALRPWQPLWLLLMPAVPEAIYYGQDYGMLFLLACIAWVLLRQGRKIAAGVAIGLLVAAKPNLALWPIFLLVSGTWRPAVAALVTAGVASLLPAIPYGPAVFFQWLAAIRADQHWHFGTDISLYAAAARFGLGPAGSAASLAACCWGLWRARKMERMRVSALAIALSLLVSPLAWIHYVVFLFPAWVDNRMGRLWAIATIGLSVPSGLVLMAGPIGGLLYPGVIAVAAQDL